MKEDELRNRKLRARINGRNFILLFVRDISRNGRGLGESGRKKVHETACEKGVINISNVGLMW
jgi:hypothetical protein